MASILVISLCTEPPVGSGFLLWLCVRATRGGEGPVGGKKGFWLGVVKHGGKKRKRKRKGEGEGFRLCCDSSRFFLRSSLDGVTLVA